MTKNVFNDYLQKFDLTKKDLAGLLNLPYPTVNGWNGVIKPFPLWLESWFHHYEKSLKFDKICELVKPEI